MFFTLMAVELLYEWITQKKTYRLNDAMTNINTGILQQLSNTFIAVLKIAFYSWIFTHFRLFTLPENGWTFILALILWDFFYYWEHRMAHTINLFWGGHIVHHQSEEFNLSVALRQTSTGFIWGIPFYLPMAFLGISPIQFLFVGGINLLYQFWIHTEHINKLPSFLEAILNTPSHHRVHHGRDPKYIDKNYAGMLIIWDRMFNTFQIEEERPHYGITTPLKSWNPVYANFSHYLYLVKSWSKVKGLKDKAMFLFHKPGWRPDYLGGELEVKEVESNYKKYDSNNSPLSLYIFIQFLISLIINAVYFFNFSNYTIETKTLMALWIVFSTCSFGFLLEKRNKWVYALEGIRVLSLLTVIPLTINGSLIFDTLSILAITAVLLISLLLYVYATKRNTV